MKNKSFPYLIYILSITCLIFILFLSMLFKKEYKKEETKFHLQIGSILQGKVSQQIFPESPINFSELSSSICISLSENRILTPFSWGFIDHQQDEFIYISDSTYLHQIKTSHHTYSYSTSFHSISGEDSILRNSVVLYFPKESAYIFHELYGFFCVFVLLVILIFILFVFSLAIYFLFRQKKNSKKKNDYVNRMTHEVKTPVATSLLALEALNDKEYPCDEEMQEVYLQIIKNEVLRSQEMVLQILNQTKYESINSHIEKTKINLHEIIEKSAQSMSLPVRKKEGEITLSLHATSPYVFGNLLHLNNIIINLIENANKYTAEKPYIQISTQDRGKGIEIRIQDNGIGIAPPDQKKIFKKYYRASNNPNKESFGIGLNYVQHVVKLHKGKIRVESELGKGSVFIIYLRRYFS